MYQRTTKKFGISSKVWTLFGEYYLRRGQADEARELLPRSLKSLEKRKRKLWIHIQCYSALNFGICLRRQDHYEVCANGV